MHHPGSRVLRLTVPGAVLIALAACGGAGSDSSTTQPRTPAAMSAVTTTSFDVAAGATVAPSPAVKVTDASGAPMSGVSVSFTASGGTLAGAQATTDAGGIATVGSWTAATTPGANTLTASAGALPTVTFSARVTAGPPATVAKIAGDSESAVGGSTLPVAPKVRVTDSFGNPIAGASVVFGVTAGGGSITGASVTTAADGSAAVGSWTLGTARSGDVVNSLSATVAGVAPTTFNATALDPCGIANAYALFTTATADFSTLDCQYDTKQYVDFYVFSVPALQVVELTESSNAVDTYLRLSDSTGMRIATNNDAVTGQPNSRIRAILLPGRYIAEASTAQANVTGAYTLASLTSSATITNCDNVFVSEGQGIGSINATQSITNTDCVDSYGDYWDGYWMALRPGKTVTISMTSPDFFIALTVYAPDGTVAAYTDDYNSSQTSVTFTPTQAGFYYIAAGTYFANQLGSYTIVFP